MSAGGADNDDDDNDDSKTLSNERGRKSSHPPPPPSSEFNCPDSGSRFDSRINNVSNSVMNVASPVTARVARADHTQKMFNAKYPTSTGTVIRMYNDHKNGF